MTDQPVQAQVLNWDGFALDGGGNAWTQLIAPSATDGGTRWGYLRIRNTTNIRIEGKFGTGSTGHFFIDAGEKDEWNITRDPVAGTVFVRGATADPASGDVTADGLV